MNLEQAHATIREDFGNNPEVLNACLKIINTIHQTESEQSLQHLTYNYFREQYNIKNDNTLLKVINYLCGSRLSVLDKNFAFIDDENDIDEPLESEEVSVAIKTNKFYHPITGEPFTDFKKYIFIYFSVNKEFFSNLKSKSNDVN